MPDENKYMTYRQGMIWIISLSSGVVMCAISIIFFISNISKEVDQLKYANEFFQKEKVEQKETLQTILVTVKRLEEYQIADRARKELLEEMEKNKKRTH